MKLRVGVIFGGRSVEHDVSVVTAQQVISAMNPERYDVKPIYIDREGKWFTGAPLLDFKTFRNPNFTTLPGVMSCNLGANAAYPGLVSPPVTNYLSKTTFDKLDVVFPVIHGSHGEDGTLQGLLELVDLPYVGSGVTGSAIGIDKFITKLVLQHHGIPVLPSLTFHRSEWMEDFEEIATRIENTLSYPVFIKPASVGSSIGITRLDSREDLLNSVEVAMNFAEYILIEKAAVGCIEVQCAVMGNQKVQVSVCEQPLSYLDFLTFEEKYMNGGTKGMYDARRIIPAPISESLTTAVQDNAARAFKAIRGRGMARVDFLVNPETEEFYINEINTLPGSLALYLWEHGGMTREAVIDNLIKLAQEAHYDKKQTQYSQDTGLLQHMGSGVKGAKSPAHNT